jgi:hypothetical protein
MSGGSRPDGPTDCRPDRAFFYGEAAGTQPVGGAVVSLSPRALRRLRIARRLLDSEPSRYSLPRGHRVPDSRGIWTEILAILESLPPAEQADLRSAVDWIERYEFTDASVS